MNWGINWMCAKKGHIPPPRRTGAGMLSGDIGFTAPRVVRKIEKPRICRRDFQSHCRSTPSPNMFECVFEWFLMIFDDVWWFLMIFDDVWWFLMIFDDVWWFLMMFDDFWWFLMIFDDVWWFLMIFDDFNIVQSNVQLMASNRFTHLGCQAPRGRTGRQHLMGWGWSHDILGCPPTHLPSSPDTFPVIFKRHIWSHQHCPTTCQWCCTFELRVLQVKGFWAQGDESGQNFQHLSKFYQIIHSEVHPQIPKIP